MNRFNADKLLLSKWTAVAPIDRQKHFIVTELVRDETDQHVVSCMLEAVINKRLFPIDCSDLKDSQFWLQGWK